MKIRCLVCKAEGYSVPQETEMDIPHVGRCYSDGILAIANKFRAEYNEQPELSALGMVVFKKANVKFCGIEVL